MQFYNKGVTERSWGRRCITWAH